MDNTLPGLPQGPTTEDQEILERAKISHQDLRTAFLREILLDWEKRGYYPSQLEMVEATYDHITKVYIQPKPWDKFENQGALWQYQDDQSWQDPNR